MPGSVCLQETRCEPGLRRSEQKTQSQDVCFGFLLTQLILLTWPLLNIHAHQHLGN